MSGHVYLSCQDCGEPTNVVYSRYGNIPLCDTCYISREHKKLSDKYENSSKDFTSWSSSDISEMFWLHLGTYVKHPNRESLNIMFAAKRWAGHNDKGLANSFSNALKWAKIDLYSEMKRLSAVQN